MGFTREKHDMSDQNHERCFFTCEFRAKIPAFYCSLQRRFTHIQREKFYSKGFSC